MGTSTAYQRSEPAGLVPARSANGAVTGCCPSARKAWSDGYDQRLVDTMRLDSVDFGIALADGGSQCDVQTIPRKVPQHPSAAPVRAHVDPRWRR